MAKRDVTKLRQFDATPAAKQKFIFQQVGHKHWKDWYGTVSIYVDDGAYIVGPRVSWFFEAGGTRSFPTPLAAFNYARHLVAA